MSSTRFYKTWAEMFRRCYNVASKSYPNYGGRGIVVTDRWKTFENFLEDMFESYRNHVDKYGEVDTTLDRIDVNGNYCPDNCRWATRFEQNINQRVRKDSKTGVTGVIKHRNGTYLARIKREGTYYVLGFFEDFDEAVKVRKDAEKVYHNPNFKGNGSDV